MGWVAVKHRTEVALPQYDWLRPQHKAGKIC
jgi:hypothetical protein